MTDYGKVPQAVIQNGHRRALARRPQPCDLCGAYPSVLYAAGRRCRSCAEASGMQVDAPAGAYGADLRDAVVAMRTWETT